MFIHWGIYACDARHEQAWRKYNIPTDDYCALANSFNPTSFNPDAWLDLAETAGMEYLVFTTKHHDGFCMWDSKHTEFNIMNSSYQKDICKMIADTCAKRNFPLEWYYSVVDWNQINYPNIGRHHEIQTDPQCHDWDKYKAFLNAQIEELCTNYGEIHGIWWDMNVPKDIDPSVHEKIRQLQPKAIINNRGFGLGDYGTPERDFDPEGANVHGGADYIATEACQSVGVNSWGYRAHEDYFSVKYFLRNIDRFLARGANYLLNVGPDEKGNIPEESTHILTEIGKWYHAVKESFCTPVYKVLEDKTLLTTQNENTLYVHCPNGLTSSTLTLYPLESSPKSVTLLNNGQAIPFTLEPITYQQDKGPHLRLINIPVNTLESTVPIFKIKF